MENLHFIVFHNSGVELYEFQDFHNFRKKKKKHDVHNSGVKFVEFRYFLCDLKVNN